MNKNLKKVTLWNIVWFLVYIIPFINWIVYAIVNNGQNFESLIAFDRTNIGFQYAIDRNNIFFTWVVDVYKVLSGNNSFVLGSNFESILLIVCYWFIMVSLFRILIDFILIVPRICNNFMNKLTRQERSDL